MKKLLALCCVFCLVGCSSSEPIKKTVVCEAKLDGGAEQKITLEAEDDTLLVQRAESSLDFSTLGVEQDQIEGIVKEFEDQYDVTGITYSYSIDGPVLSETIEADYQKADLKELIQKGFLESEDENITVVSLEKTIKNLEKEGYTCK